MEKNDYERLAEVVNNAVDTKLGIVQPRNRAERRQKQFRSTKRQKFLDGVAAQVKKRLYIESIEKIHAINEKNKVKETESNGEPESGNQGTELN